MIPDQLPKLLSWESKKCHICGDLSCHQVGWLCPACFSLWHNEAIIDSESILAARGIWADFRKLPPQPKPNSELIKLFARTTERSYSHEPMMMWLAQHGYSRATYDAHYRDIVGAFAWYRLGTKPSYPCPVCGGETDTWISSDHEHRSSCLAGHWSSEESFGWFGERVDKDEWCWNDTESTVASQLRHYEIAQAKGLLIHKLFAVNP